MNIDNTSIIGQSLIYLFDNNLIEYSDVIELYRDIVIEENKILNEDETIYDILIDYSIKLLTIQSENDIDTKELFDNLAVIYDIKDLNKQKYFEIFNTIIKYHEMQKINEEFPERDIKQITNIAK